MNLQADESKGHFDGLIANINQWDLLLVLVWSWKKADKDRVFPCILRKEVKPEVKQQLLDSLRRTEVGERGVSAEEVAKKLGLSW